MKELTYISDSPQKTWEAGFKLGNMMFPGALITLSGELGAGKTVLAKGLGKGLGVEKTITSPTFTIMKNYMGRLPFNHIDAYRLEDIQQDLGFDEYIEGDGVTVIEWAGFIEELLPEEYLNVEITINDDDTRTLRLTAAGEKYEEVLEQLCLH